MPHHCEECQRAVALLDAQTSSGSRVWHTRCWNAAWERDQELFRELEEAEGFTLRSDFTNVRKPARSIPVFVSSITKEVA
jgi:hypothetical protein